MADIDFWRLCNEYSVMNAALLIVGQYPHDIECSQDHHKERGAPGYLAVRTALCGAIESGQLKVINLATEGDESYYGETIDVRKTKIAVSDLHEFMTSRGYYCDIFVREPSIEIPSNSAASPFFSKKLNAANAAWEAVTADATLLSGKSPKRALEDWLTEHAPELGLLNRDGQPNRTGIEEISKVANWKPEGGATPTPSVRPPQSPVPRIAEGGFGRRRTPEPAKPKASWPDDLDDGPLF